MPVHLSRTASNTHGESVEKPGQISVSTKGLISTSLCLSGRGIKETPLHFRASL